MAKPELVLSGSPSEGSESGTELAFFLSPRIFQGMIHCRVDDRK